MIAKKEMTRKASSCWKRQKNVKVAK